MTIVRRIGAALALAAGLAAAPAQATVITAGTYDFNLDFTGAPPYTWANVQFVLASLAAGQHLGITFFTGLNEGGTALGPAIFLGPFAGPATITVGTQDAGLSDGLFSVRFTLDTGTADIASAIALVTNSFGGPVIASAPLVFQGAVPEPVPLALLALGLGAFALARRRPNGRGERAGSRAWHQRTAMP